MNEAEHLDSPATGVLDPQRGERLLTLARYFSPRPNRPLPVVGGNDIRLLVNGNEVFAAMLSAILVAKRSIDIEIYIWHADRIGLRLAELLKAKSAEGVRVRVIYDSFGCLMEPPSLWRGLARAGVELAEFNPVSLWRRKRGAGRLYRRRTVHHRDHRKIIIVDNEVAYTGGINIGDEYTGDGNDLHHWRDTCVQVRGPAVAQLAGLFRDQWQTVTGQTAGERAIPGPAAGNDVACVLGSRPWRVNDIRGAIRTAIRRARRRIEITMAYFMPPLRMVRALCKAARRGVEVRLILPAHSDVWPVFHAGRSTYERLLRAGVRIYECEGTILHAKTIQVDDVWATVGSANLDLRSFRLNDEVNIVVLGRQLASQLSEVFHRDLARSRRILLDDWLKRPWSDKLKERFYRLFRFWL